MLCDSPWQYIYGWQFHGEAAIHSTRANFDDDNTEALLLIDATNAFNSINRTAMLHNLKHLCPTIAQCVKNSYQSPSRLFVQGGLEIASSEGKTQGDLLVSTSYSIAILPLLQKCETPNVKQGAFADDIRGSGKLASLHNWWLSIEEIGPKYGYFPKASNSWLITKPDMVEAA